jgi:hypothetical protein
MAAAETLMVTSTSAPFGSHQPASTPNGLYLIAETDENAD